MKNWPIYLLILCLPWYGFWMLPQWQQYQLQRVSLTEKQIQTKANQIRIAELKAKAQATDQERSGALKAIPTSTKQEIILLDLQAIATQTGFEFSNLNFSLGKDASTSASKLEVGVQFRGPKVNLIELLKKIESNPRFLALEYLNLTHETLNGVELVVLNAQLYALAQADWETSLTPAP